MNTRVCTQARQPVSRASGDRARPGQACVRMPGDPGRGDGPGLGLSVCVPAVWPWGTPSLGHCVCVCVCAHVSEDQVHSLEGRAHHPRASPPVTGGHTLHQTVSGSWGQTVALASGMGNSCFLENSWCPCWRPPRACDSAVVLGGCCH